MSHSELPQYLSERLAEDQARFGSNQTKEQLEEQLLAHTKRHETILAERAAHAKSIGEGHHHHHNTTSSELEENVHAKRIILEEQKNELNFLEERIKLTEEKRKELEFKLQLQTGKVI